MSRKRNRNGTASTASTPTATPGKSPTAVAATVASASPSTSGMTSQQRAATGKAAAAALARARAAAASAQKKKQRKKKRKSDKKAAKGTTTSTTTTTAAKGGGGGKAAPGSNWAALAKRLRPKGGGKSQQIGGGAAAAAPVRRARGMSQDVADEAPVPSPPRKRQRQRSMSNGVTGGLTKYLALDCEMVGVGDGTESALAQVCIVNYHGEVVYMNYVKTVERVVDYRTHVSGILPHHLRNAPSFKKVQEQVAAIVKDRILVGHGLKNDFQALLLSHPRSMIRDSAVYPPFCFARRPGGKGRPQRLKALAKAILGRDIQTGEHSPAEDAIASMDVYKAHSKHWEAWICGALKRPPPVPALLAYREQVRAERRAARAVARGRDPKPARADTAAAGGGGGGAAKPKAASTSNGDSKAPTSTAALASSFVGGGGGAGGGAGAGAAASFVAWGNGSGALDDGASAKARLKDKLTSKKGKTLQPWQIRRMRQGLGSGSRKRKAGATAKAKKGKQSAD